MFVPWVDKWCEQRLFIAGQDSDKKILHNTFLLYMLLML